MLYTLGLRRFPPVEVLIGLAAGRAPTNDLALQYLLANSQNHYVNFDPSTFSAVEFLPATMPNGDHISAKPGDVSPVAVSA